MREWVRVELRYATFAVLVQDGFVVDAAPIARWAIGRPEVAVASYYRRRGARFDRLTAGRSG
jgi:hypothetical protein